SAFDKLSSGRTTIVIAHRLSTIRGAQKIVVIEEDGIAEHGSHEELLAKGGEYAKLYRLQNSMF
ncbi:MAG: ABC transporter ATP-binding protein, partial [Oscillospiraceae bacterium]|nr:ABC transporter ATP-binding protein [Oscillospiraceae bacterium]